MVSHPGAFPPPLGGGGAGFGFGQPLTMGEDAMIVDRASTTLHMFREAAVYCC